MSSLPYQAWVGLCSVQQPLPSEYNTAHLLATRKARTDYNGNRKTPRLAVGVFLARLETPAQSLDMERLVRKFAPQLSEIFQEAFHGFIYAQADLLEGDIPASFVEATARWYSGSVFNKCAGLENVVDFIDGTVLVIAHPSCPDPNQLTVYNGHKRNHTLNFQAKTTPMVFSDICTDRRWVADTSCSCAPMQTSRSSWEFFFS